MNHLLILSKAADRYEKLIRKKQLSDITIHCAGSAEDASSLIGSCNIILGDPPVATDVLAQASSLDWLQSTYAGVDALCGPGRRDDYTLTLVKDVFGPLMSEYTFAYILGLERGLFSMRESQRQNSWSPQGYKALSTRTLGVCGLGSIGSHIAQTGEHFGMRVLGYRNSPTPHPNVERVYTRDGLDEFLSDLDYLVITLPSTADTKHLFNSETLASMKSGSVLINVGRGSLIDEDALAHALASNAIKAAVLDVFETEPLASSSPLWQLPNAYISPHCAAYSFPEDITEIFAANYQLFRHGKTLNHVFDFKKGY